MGRRSVVFPVSTLFLRFDNPRLISLPRCPMRAGGESQSLVSRFMMVIMLCFASIFWKGAWRWG